MSSFRIGDLIYQSMPYVYVLNDSLKGQRCDNCFQKQSNLRRCSQCLFMYYCDQKCQKKSWDVHKKECNYIKQAAPEFPTNSVRLLTHICFKLMEYGPSEPTEDIHGYKMNFLRLMSHVEEIKNNKDARLKLTLAVKLLLKFVGVDNIPSCMEFSDIFGKMLINAFSICDGEMQSIGTGLYLGPSIFDHSCEPDAEVVFDGLNMQIRAVRDIPHTDVTKIYISYIDQLQLKQERQNSLREQYYFYCQCPRCTSSYHEDLMTKTLKSDVENVVAKFKEEVKLLKVMKKDKKFSSCVLYEACIDLLEQQEDILADTHILKVKTLEIAFDACIDNMQWTDAITLGKQVIEPYKLLYGRYHPIFGIHLFKVGKLQNLQGLIESAKSNLSQAKEILKITHGEEHPLYKNLLEVLHECYT